MIHRLPINAASQLPAISSKQILLHGDSGKALGTKQGSAILPGSSIPVCDIP
jgi:hypothetical protein